MNKPVFRVVGLDHATCDSEYDGVETSTQSTKVELFEAKLGIYSPCEPESVTIRLCDLLAAIPSTASNRLAWVQDFADDPVVISKDLYEVLLTYKRMKNAA
ncbi:MAG: hypothetical protein NTY15_10720 [Planctomycetota bacterium]|nr:hypothetical protein [Planctomycetota bacterium]